VATPGETREERSQAAGSLSGVHRRDPTHHTPRRTPIRYALRPGRATRRGRGTEGSSSPQEPPPRRAPTRTKHGLSRRRVNQPLMRPEQACIEASSSAIDVQLPTLARTRSRYRQGRSLLWIEARLNSRPPRTLPPPGSNPHTGGLMKWGRSGVAGEQFYSSTHGNERGTESRTLQGTHGQGLRWRGLSRHTLVTFGTTHQTGWRATGPLDGTAGAGGYATTAIPPAPP